MNFSRSTSLFFLLILSFTKAHSTQIHAFVAADTTSNIRHSSKHDLTNIKNALKTVSESSNTPLNLCELTGTKLAFGAVTSWAKKVRSTNSDIVFFYFTGHGIRSKESMTIWPALYFISPPKLVDMHMIAEKIKKIPARLHIIISDCCNNMHRRAQIFFPKSIPFQESMRAHTQRGYRKLFLETQGVIIASGAVPGEIAWATDQGGIFTNALLESLRYEMSNYPDADWQRIFERSNSLCKPLQNPQHVLHIAPFQG